MAWLWLCGPCIGAWRCRHAACMAPIPRCVHVHSCRSKSVNVCADVWIGPSVCACREIKQLQRSTNLLLRKAPFQRIVREITQKISAETNHFQPAALEALQEAAEAYLVSPRVPSARSPCAHAMGHACSRVCAEGCMRYACGRVCMRIAFGHPCQRHNPEGSHTPLLPLMHRRSTSWRTATWLPFTRGV